jgi:hypothetical protein
VAPTREGRNSPEKNENGEILEKMIQGYVKGI